MGRIIKNVGSWIRANVLAPSFPSLGWELIATASYYKDYYDKLTLQCWRSGHETFGWLTIPGGDGDTVVKLVGLDFLDFVESFGEFHDSLNEWDRRRACGKDVTDVYPSLQEGPKMSRFRRFIRLPAPNIVSVAFYADTRTYLSAWTFARKGSVFGQIKLNNQSISGIVGMSDEMKYRRFLSSVKDMSDLLAKDRVRPWDVVVAKTVRAAPQDQTNFPDRQ